MRQIFIAKAERFWNSDSLKRLHGASQTLLAEPGVARGLLEELRSLLMVLHADQVRALAWVFFFDCRKMLSVWGTDYLLYCAHFRRVVRVPCQLLKVRPLVILRVGKLNQFLVVRLVRRAERVICLVLMLWVVQGLLIRCGIRVTCRVLENNSPAVLLIVWQIEAQMVLVPQKLVTAVRLKDIDSCRLRWHYQTCVIYNVITGSTRVQQLLQVWDLFLLPNSCVLVQYSLLIRLLTQLSDRYNLLEIFFIVIVVHNVDLWLNLLHIITIRTT